MSRWLCFWTGIYCASLMFIDSVWFYQGWLFMPGDYPAIIRSQGFSRRVANWRLWLGALLLVRDNTLIGPFIGGGVPRKTIPSIGLLLPILRNFLFWLRTSNKLSVSAVLGYRSKISAVFRMGGRKLRLPRCFMPCHGGAPARSVTPPSWDF